MVYKAAGYVRASRDDTDSSTIENQIKIIKDYAARMPDVQLVSTYEDSGFSGVNFARPAFAQMMRDIEDGRVNCVIIKDFSRLGRNYIEVGRLTSITFVELGTRLISIGDSHDSLDAKSGTDDIFIAFKHLIDEHYLREASNKIRASLDAKRVNGEFVGAFAPYGYRRDEGDRGRLVVDKPAARVVRRIFEMKIEGKSKKGIADHFNEAFEPSPAEYKKLVTNYKANFQTRERALWSAVAVGRVLANPVYIGTLVQGKQTTPSFKVKKRVDRPESEWYIMEDAHEAIISKEDFEIVQGLLASDTRAAPGKSEVYPLSGLVFCGHCGNSVVRTKAYYVCASSRGREKACTERLVRHGELERVVREALGGGELSRAVVARAVERVEVSEGRGVVVVLRGCGDG
ncbi:MAG: recombinase family protein [Defluviitaleaceae bacterium]|nr:recombinase family protein [Defluviitaleaceae bacterium]